MDQSVVQVETSGGLRNIVGLLDGGPNLPARGRDSLRPSPYYFGDLFTGSMRQEACLTVELIAEHAVDILPAAAWDSEQGLCRDTGQWTNTTAAICRRSVQLKVEVRRSLLTRRRRHHHTCTVLSQSFELDETVLEQSLGYGDLSRLTTCHAVYASGRDNAR